MMDCTFLLDAQAKQLLPQHANLLLPKPRLCSRGPRLDSSVRRRVLHRQDVRTRDSAAYSEAVPAPAPTQEESATAEWAANVADAELTVDAKDVAEPAIVPQHEVPKKKGPFKRFWKAYSRALDTNPIAVKSATSLIGFAIGDILAQVIVGVRAGVPYNLMRTLRMMAFGVLMDGPVGHVWYTFLDRNIMPNKSRSNRAVIAKMLLDQLLWAPFFTCVFFTVINLLEGNPHAIVPAIQQKLIPVFMANLVLWPAAHIINFKFVPSQQRILYINCVQVIWSAYLSNQSARGIKVVVA